MPTYSASAVERLLGRQGWQRQPLDLRMAFDRRADLEAVLRIEFTPEVAERAIAETPGLELPYPTCCAGGSSEGLTLTSVSTFNVNPCASESWPNGPG